MDKLTAIIIISGLVIVSLSLLGVSIVRLFERDPDRGMELFGAVGMLVHSIFKSKHAKAGHKHRRRSDPTDAPPHGHRRQTPRDMPTIRMFAPRRRPTGEHDTEGDDHRRPDAPPHREGEL